MKTRTGEGGRYSAKHEYLLAGKVFCGECGGAMVITGCNQSKDGRQYRYYNCVNKRQSHTCTAKGIGSVTLEAMVAEAVKRQLGTQDAAERIIQVAIKYRDAIQQGAAPKNSAIDKELKELDKKIARLVDALADDIASDAVTVRLGELEDRKAQLTAAKRMLDNAENEVGLTDEQICQAVERLAAANLDSQDGLRTLLAIVLRVTVYADHIEVVTLFGGGKPGDKPDIPGLQKAALDFITSIGAPPPAPGRNGLRSIPKAQPVGWAFLMPLCHLFFFPQNFFMQTFAPLPAKKGRGVHFVTPTHGLCAAASAAALLMRRKKQREGMLAFPPALLCLNHLVQNPLAADSAVAGPSVSTNMPFSSLA